MKKNTCLECGEEIKGRADKKFCDDNCRNNHNNKINSEGNNLVRNVNNILRKNRRILKSILKRDDIKNVMRQKLIDQQFNFKYYTNIQNTSKQTTYYHCYDYGYRYLENDIIMIVKQSNKHKEKVAE
jgi:hypothetical protein